MMDSIVIGLNDGSFKELSDLLEINVSKDSDGSIKNIKENDFPTLIPNAGNSYVFITQDEIFTISGKNIKSLNFYK